MAIVLVTGGTRGIGAACVRWFLDHGDQVATTFRSADPPDAPEGTAPERFLAVPCDVRNTEDVEAAFATIEEEWGPGRSPRGQRRDHHGRPHAPHERPGLR